MKKADELRILRGVETFQDSSATTDIYGVLHELARSHAQQWRRKAACRDISWELFFPARGMKNCWAKEICAQCTVASDCLAEALEYDYYGVWGGMTAEERKALRGQARRSSTSEQPPPIQHLESLVG